MFFIATGEYGKGINILETALNFTKQDIIEGYVHKVSPCTCRDCSFESCLFMERDSFISCLMQSIEPQENKNQSIEVEEKKDLHVKEGHKQIQGTYPNITNTNWTNTIPTMYTLCCESFYGRKDDNNGFVYQQTLLINKKCIEENHNMEMTLSLIIIFNLALAHHLWAISTHAQPSNTNLRVLQKAVQFYGLAYQLHDTYPTTINED